MPLFNKGESAGPERASQYPGTTQLVWMEPGPELSTCSRPAWRVNHTGTKLAWAPQTPQGDAGLQATRDKTRMTSDPGLKITPGPLTRQPGDITGLPWWLRR